MLAYGDFCLTGGTGGVVAIHVKVKITLCNRISLLVVRSIR